MVRSLVRRMREVPGLAEATQRISVQIQRGWWDGAVLTLDGCAFAYGRDDLDRPICFEATATQRWRRSLAFDVRPYSSIEVDTYVNDEEHAHGDAAFVASLDLARVRRPGRWRLEAGVPMTEGLGWKHVTWLYRWGSAWHLKAVDLPSGLAARLEWDAEQGLDLVVERPEVRARACDQPGAVELTGSGVTVARLVRDDHDAVVLPLGRDSRVTMPAGLAPGRWRLEAVRDGQPVAPVWEALGPLGVDLATDEPDVRLASTREGRVVVDVTPEHVVVEGVERVRVEAGHPAVTITGRAHGVDPATLILSGPRVDLVAHAVETDPDRFRVTYVLWTRMPWARAESIVPPGGYRLMTPNGTCAVPDAAWLPSLYERVAMPEVFLRYECAPDDGTFYLHTSNPRTDDEMGPYRQRRLHLWHREAAHEPRDAVLFESFSGRSANDNTAAIAADLVARRPDLTPYWSVVDRSVVVPDGITPVLRYSREWWGIVSSSRLVVTNSWLPGAFTRHPHQRVMQAWHGTPYKTLGVDRIGVAERDGRGDDVARQAATWSQMIAQSPFAADAFRSAYRLADDLEMLTIGYPRNDVLVTATEADVAAVRERLGVRPGQRVVMYMPTWREDSKEIFAELDLDDLTAALGPDTVVLVRGHSNTIKHGRRVDRPGIIDATLYPDAAELYLATDVLITDYSSAMFDFSVTGRPILFFTPDLERYVSALRGVYFDLAATAPGPLLSSTAEVVDAVRDIDAVHAAHAERYRVWRQTYNPFDDGHATRRAVDALLSTGG